MKIKPSDKIKRRYLLIAGKKEDIEKSILDYIGILGWAKAKAVFVSHSDKESVLSVDRAEVVNVRAAFEASGFDIKVRRISGTLKGIGRNKSFN